MTPAQKRAAGLGVVGYVRVSAAGQTDGWSLGTQEATIRTWAAQHDLPVIAIEQAPAGHESGATAFHDRVGWQAVERHLATGRVGWIAVATVDRLSRDLGALAAQMRQWVDQDIAIVAPAQGYGQLEGVGPFLLHLFGAFADHERKRLISRVLPGMRARLEAGLPLGRQPYGYRVVADAPVAGQRPRDHLEPDPHTAPRVIALVDQALAEPAWGARRLAAWAQQRFPDERWSPGRVAAMLAHPVYAGALRGELRGEPVVLLNNHPPIIPPPVFQRLQEQIRLRAGDHAAGLNAGAATSWLGGIVTCGRCGGTVTWRTPSDGVGGRYACIGGHRPQPDQPPQGSCGMVWGIEIETFVWRAIERLLEQDEQTLHRIAGSAIDTLPACLDERRRTAAAALAAADAAEASDTDDLAAGRLAPDAYAAACDARRTARAAAHGLLDEVDGWTYLAQLITVRDGPDGGRWRWVPLQAALLGMPLPERRRLLRGIATHIALQDPTRIGSLDGPPEDPSAGRFLGVVITRPAAAGAATSLATALAHLLVHQPGWDVDRGLTDLGWTRDTTGTGAITASGTAWRHLPSGVSVSIQPGASPPR